MNDICGINSRRNRSPPHPKPKRRPPSSHPNVSTSTTPGPKDRHPSAQAKCIIALRQAQNVIIRPPSPTGRTPTTRAQCIVVPRSQAQKTAPPHCQAQRAAIPQPRPPAWVRPHLSSLVLPTPNGVSTTPQTPTDPRYPCSGSSHLKIVSIPSQECLSIAMHVRSNAPRRHSTRKEARVAKARLCGAMQLGYLQRDDSSWENRSLSSAAFAPS